MSKVLIIGAGLLQVPAFVIARRLGIASVAIDRNLNAPGMALADVAHAVDTRDESAIVEVARRERVDGVLTLCTDAPVRVVAAVARAMGLPALSPESAFRATNKAAMRDALAAGGVPAPRFRRATSFDDAQRAAAELGYPVILKPTSSSGSRGIFKASCGDLLAQGYEYTRAASGQEREVLVEEFVTGDEVSVETLSFAGRHEIIAITDKRTSGDPHWVETGHVQPSRLGVQALTAIGRCASAALDALGIENAAGHVEIKVGPSGARLIEAGARLGGDFITTELVPRSTGVDMVEAVIRVALGETPNTTARWNRGASVRYLKCGSGRVTRIRGMEAAARMPGVVRAELTVHVGDALGGGTSSVDRPGFVICEGVDAREAEERALAAAACISVDVD